MIYSLKAFTRPSLASRPYPASHGTMKGGSILILNPITLSSSMSRYVVLFPHNVALC
jgi:hypothetical protein